MNVISLSDRRQLEMGQETIFESRSGRLFQATLADLPSIPIENNSTPKATDSRRKKKRKKKTESKRTNSEGSSSESDQVIKSDGGGDRKTTPETPDGEAV